MWWSFFFFFDDLILWAKAGLWILLVIWKPCDVSASRETDDSSRHHGPNWRPLITSQCLWCSKSFRGPLIGRSPRMTLRPIVVEFVWRLGVGAGAIKAGRGGGAIKAVENDLRNIDVSLASLKCIFYFFFRKWKSCLHIFFFVRFFKSIYCSLPLVKVINEKRPAEFSRINKCIFSFKNEKISLAYFSSENEIRQVVLQPLITERIILIDFVNKMYFIFFSFEYENLVYIFSSENEIYTSNISSYRY